MAQITDEIMIIPASNPNRPGADLEGGVVVKKRLLRGGAPSWLTGHNTGNRKKGAGARMHARFVENGGGPEEVSFHATADRLLSIQLLPWDEVAYHAGDGTGNGNYDSLALEICVDEYPVDFEDTLINSERVFRGWMEEFEVPLWRVVQHNNWSGKDCPHEMRIESGKWWKAFLNMLAAKPTPGPNPTPGPVPGPPDGPLHFPETDHSINHGFKELWIKDGLWRCGYPLSEEYAVVIKGRQYIMQDFENNMMQYDGPGTQPKYAAAVRMLKYEV